MEDDDGYLEYWRDDDPFSGPGCLFPGECLVMEPHDMEECYTAEMMAEQWAYYEHLEKYERSRVYRIYWHVRDAWYRVKAIPWHMAWWMHRKSESQSEDEIPF